MKNAGPFIWDDERAGKILGYKVLSAKFWPQSAKKLQQMKIKYIKVADNVVYLQKEDIR